MNDLTSDGGLRYEKDLKEACRRLGGLAYEEAYWILISGEGRGRTKWINACELGFDDSSEDPFWRRIRFVDRAMQRMSPTISAELEQQMNAADCILHVHNHPNLPIPNTYSLCEPSEEDIEFAREWKLRCPSLSPRMRFFVIKGMEYKEY